MSNKVPQDPVSHGDIKRFYDTEYYLDDQQGGVLPWHVKQIASRLGNLQGLRVLDIACGRGEWLAELKARGAIPSGIDISARAVSGCKKRLPQADVREGVAESLPFGDASFDLVTCMGSLEHFLDQPAALGEMRRVATADARVLILVPNAGFLTRRLGLYRGTGQRAARETVRELSDWESMLKAAGLDVHARWRDLHTVNPSWIKSGPVAQWPLRAAQAAALLVWPLAWQYQVYFLCRLRK